MTNHKRLDENYESHMNEIVSEGQEPINVAPGLDDDADKDDLEMVGFDDVAEDLKPGQNDEMADGEFYDDHHSGNDFLELEEQAESVRALTLKDGVNYDDDRFDESKVIQLEAQYPPGYNENDDLDGDGKIDKVEHQVKVHDRMDVIAEELKD